MQFARKVCLRVRKPDTLEGGRENEIGKWLCKASRERGETGSLSPNLVSVNLARGNHFEFHSGTAAESVENSLQLHKAALRTKKRSLPFR